jgi:nitrous oxidase accessory protein NosD
MALETPNQRKEESMRRLFILVAFLVLAIPLNALGVTTPVDCETDPSALGSAIGAAGVGDTLEITGTCTGTFTINQDLTLAGTSESTLDAQEAGTVLTIGSGATVVVRYLTITGGKDTGAYAAGGIRNEGTLTLEYSRVSGNEVTGHFAAVAGIANGGAASLTLMHSSVSKNRGSWSGSGSSGPSGGIKHTGPSGHLMLMQSTVSQNQVSGPESVGAIWTNRPITLMHSTVSKNEASGWASTGGMYMTFGPALIVNSTVTKNTAAGDRTTGGISNNAALTLVDSTVTKNIATFDGMGVGDLTGGIFTFVGQLTLEYSTVSKNTASGSGVSGFAAGGINRSTFANLTPVPILTNSSVEKNSPNNCLGFSVAGCE